MLDHTVYHLDGAGQLGDLDMVLGIENLNAVQWVYGDGAPSAKHWIHIYKRIEEAGKGIYTVGDADDFLAVYAQVKNHLYYNGMFTQKDRCIAEKLLNC